MKLENVQLLQLKITHNILHFSTQRSEKSYNLLYTALQRCHIISVNICFVFFFFFLFCSIIPFVLYRGWWKTILIFSFILQPYEPPSQEMFLNSLIPFQIKLYNNIFSQGMEGGWGDRLTSLMSPLDMLTFINPNRDSSHFIENLKGSRHAMRVWHYNSIMVLLLQYL